MKNAEHAVNVPGAINRQLNRDITTFVPHYPPADSVRGRVLGRLIRGAMMTSGDAWRDLSTSRLAATIHQLRQFGWQINSHLIIVRTRDHGRDARISEYWLDAAQRKTLGEAGRKYADLASQFERLEQ